MTLDPQFKVKRQKASHFQNKLLSISIKINISNKIYKDSKEINGTVILTPKLKILNLPIQLTILGQSQCVLFDQNQQNYHKSLETNKNTSNLFNVNETQQDIVQKRNQVQKCLHSTEYLSQNFQQNPLSEQKVQKQIFLQGKQSLFQTFGQKKQKLQILKAQKTYFYEFSFFLPNNLPSSINQQIFNGVNLLVNYKISVLLEMNEKYFVFQNQNTKKQFFSEVESFVSIQKYFQIQRRTQLSNHQTLCNKMIFKYFNQQGKQVDIQCIQSCQCLKYFYEKITKRPMNYDIYHCQIISTIDQFKNLHLTARIFIQPNKNHLDLRKVKKGKFYSSTQKQNQNIKQKNAQNSRKDEELTISKVIDTSRQKQLKVKIRNILIKMYGEIVDIKKVKIFEKIITINRQMYDICEGQMITEIPFQYFSEKNQLFQIKFWFQIQPLSDEAAELMKKQQMRSKLKTDDKTNKNQFQLTMSQLNEKQKHQQQNQHLNKQLSTNKKRKTIFINSRTIEPVNQEINQILL